MTTTPTSTPGSDSPGDDGTGVSTPGPDTDGSGAETQNTSTSDSTSTAGDGSGGESAYTTTTTAEDTDRFLLKQGDTEVIVDPLTGPDPIEDFYDYYNAKAHTNNGLEEADRTLTFFWRDPQGRISLVVIHDVGDDSGGAVSFDFEGLPTSEGSWVVKDDSGDFTSETQADWAWADPKTDGGAYTGGLDGDVSITIVPAFNEEARNEPLDPGRIESWQFLYGNLSSPDRVTLDKGQEVTLTAINRTPVAQFDVVTETPDNASLTRFDAASSFAPNATDEDYSWSFGDGTSATGSEVVHRFDEPGEYNVTLTVASSSGTSTVTRTVTVENSTVDGAAITDVTVTPSGPALSGFPMPKNVSVTVAGESPVQEVRFTIAGETVVDSDGSDGWTMQYDAGQLERSRTLQITAVTENGSTATESVQFGVEEPPSWLTTLGDLLGYAFENGELTIGGAFPQEPANIDATPPDPIPVVGGKTTTIEDTQLVFEFVYAPGDREASLGGGTDTKGEILGKDLLTQFRVSGVASTDPLALQGGNLQLQFEVEIPVYQTPIGIPSVGEVEIQVNVIPSGGGDATFTAEEGSLRTDAKINLGLEAGPTASVDVGPATVTVTGLAGVNGEAKLLPEVGDFSGNATGEVTALVEAYFFSKEYTFEVSQPLASPLGVTPSSSTGWRVVDKRGSMPLSSTVPTRGRVSPSDATFVPGSVVDSAAQRYHRITADEVRDSNPAVTTSGDRTTIVWNRQPAEKDIRAGHDLYWVTKTDTDGWGEPTRITDDERYDLDPAVAGGGTEPLTVAWSRVTANLSDSSYATPSDIYPEMDIAVTTRQDGTWGPTTLLTDDSTMDFGASIVSTGDSRVVVWQRDGDANLSTTDDRTVWYAILGSDSVGPTKLANGTDPTVAVTDDGRVRVAYAVPGDTTDTSVVVQTVSLAGASVQRTYSAASVSDVALSGTTLAWATRASANESSRVRSARYANGSWSAATTVPFPNATVGVTELKLLDRPDRDSAVLAFRGVDATDRTRVVRYRLRTGGEWLPSKPLLATEKLDVVFSQIGLAGDATRFTTAAVGQNISTNDKPDLFSVSHAYVPDLTVSAGVANGSVDAGETANLTYTVRNTGELPATASFDVVVSNGSSVVNTTTVSGLGVGENRTVTVPATVDASGTFTVRVRASNTTELTTANNDARVVATRTDLAVGSVTTAREDGNVTVTATVANPSGVDASDVRYVVTSGNETLASGQFDRLNATENRTVGVTVPATALAETRSVTVTVDPANTTAEADETNNDADSRVLLPDVAVLGDTAAAYNTTYGEYVSVLVENRGTGESEVTLAVSPPGGNATAETLTESERLGVRTVTVEGRQQANGTAYRRVLIPLRNESVMGTVEVVATTDRPDLNVDNNVGVFNLSRQPRDVSGDATFSFTPGEPVVGTNVSLSASTTVPEVLVESVTWDLNNDSQVDRRGASVVGSFDTKGEAVVTATVTTINGKTLTETRTIDVRPSNDSIIGEVDTVTANAENASDWHAVRFDTRHPDPVVLMKPASSNGSDPVHVRIRNVTPTGFEFKLEEWAYLDGSHGMERLSYVVIEAGNHTLDSGVRLVAGRVEANGSFRNVSYRTPFASNPVVITQTQTVRERQPVITRQQNGSGGGFAVKLDEEEAADRNHSAETVGFIAVTPSVGENFGLPFEASHTGTYVDEYDYHITYAREYGQPPAFLASIETTTGGDTAHPRYSSLSEAGVDVTVEEETSNDYETGHNQEQIGWVLFRNADFIYTTTASESPDEDESVPAPPALPDRAPPTDPDGDGDYEDVNGDGEFTIADVQTLFQALDRPEVQGYAAYDFNDDGEVNVIDVQRLFALALE